MDGYTSFSGDGEGKLFYLGRGSAGPASEIEVLTKVRAIVAAVAAAVVAVVVLAVVGAVAVAVGVEMSICMVRRRAHTVSCTAIDTPLTQNGC